jgi:hypothetical protein
LDDFSTPENTPLIIAAPGILQNDRDPEGSPLSTIMVSGALHGRVELNGDGSFSYTPDEGFFGQDQFSYHASDGELISEVVPVLITVQETNQPPEVEDDRFSSAAEVLLEVPAPGILGNDSDPDSEALTVQLETGPAFGELDLQVDGSFEYQPDPGFVGQDQFTYRVSDGRTLSNIGQVTIEVNAQLPAVLEDLYEMEQGQNLVVEPPGVMQNDQVLNGQLSVVELVSGPGAGQLLLNPDGSFEYTPDAEFTGEVLFQYLLRTGEAVSELATVRILVRPENSVSVPSNGLS